MKMTFLVAAHKEIPFLVIMSKIKVAFNKMAVIEQVIRCFSFF